MVDDGDRVGVLDGDGAGDADRIVVVHDTPLWQVRQPVGPPEWHEAHDEWHGAQYNPLSPTTR